MSRLPGWLITVGFLPMLVGLTIVMLAEGSGPAPSVSESRRDKVLGTTIFGAAAVLSLGSAIGLYVNTRRRK